MTYLDTLTKGKEMKLGIDRVLADRWILMARNLDQ